MNAVETIPPPNGYTKATRRIVSGFCAVTFFLLIVLDYGLGVLAKDIPSWLYGLLFGGGMMMIDAIDAIIQKLFGVKT